MASKQESTYFKIFAEMAQIANNAAIKLSAILENFDPSTLEAKMKELHEIESSGDRCKHILMEQLVKEFITPIDREDILVLINELDDVIDAIEDVLLKIYMYNISKIRPEAHEFSKIIQRCCSDLHQLMQEFCNFKKSKTMRDSIIEINRMEENGDKLYLDAMHTLYVERNDPFETTGWSEIFRMMEKCCDTCEHVADVVEGVIMKNT